MPLQNRVTPEGEIINAESRGLMMGNRGGQIHTESKELAHRRWVSKQWICCRLEFHGRKREVMAPHRYTELFFLDEATALAAGHRPCFECRRQDFLWFATLWARIHGGGDGRATAGAMDDVLHGERVDRGGHKITYQAPISTLASGTFIKIAGVPHLVIAGWLLEWTASGYRATRARPETGSVEVLTPKSIVAVLSAGYCPTLHPSTQVVS